ncbi:MAG: nuclease [Erysipelotrichaceae bacterium]|nr:nuclease [Erysipelotrichaceae bacterium]
MYTAHQVQNDHQHIIHDLRLIDNDFMNLCLNFNPACIHLILQLLIQEDHLDTQFIQTQYFMQNLTERSLCLDIFVKDELNRYFDIEFQRSNNGADKKRARYHASMMDTHVLAKGNDFKQFKDIYVIFITEHDVLGKGKSLYHIKRKIRETGELFEDGIHILYVNGSCQDDSPLGRLMHDLMCTDPDEMYYDYWQILYVTLNM